MLKTATGIFSTIVRQNFPASDDEIGLMMGNGCAFNSKGYPGGDVFPGPGRRPQIAVSEGVASNITTRRVTCNHFLPAQCLIVHDNFTTRRHDFSNEQFRDRFRRVDQK